MLESSKNVHVVWCFDVFRLSVFRNVRWIRVYKDEEWEAPCHFRTLSIFEVETGFLHAPERLFWADLYNCVV